MALFGWVEGGLRGSEDHSEARGKGVEVVAEACWSGRRASGRVQWQGYTSRIEYLASSLRASASQNGR